jgi:hypothetical protein
MPDDGLNQVRSDMIRFSCPRCGTHLRVTAEHGGKRGKCKSCGEPILVPAAEASAREARGEQIAVSSYHDRGDARRSIDRSGAEKAEAQGPPDSPSSPVGTAQINGLLKELKEACDKIKVARDSFATASANKPAILRELEAGLGGLMEAVILQQRLAPLESRLSEVSERLAVAAGDDPRKVIKALDAEMAAPANDEEYLKALADVLGKLARHADSVLPPLSRLMHKDVAASVRAVQAVAKIGGPDARKALVECLEQKRFFYFLFSGEKRYKASMKLRRAIQSALSSLTS